MYKHLRKKRSHPNVLPRLRNPLGHRRRPIPVEIDQGRPISLSLSLSLSRCRIGDRLVTPPPSPSRASSSSSSARRTCGAPTQPSSPSSVSPPKSEPNPFPDSTRRRRRRRPGIPLHPRSCPAADSPGRAGTGASARRLDGGARGEARFWSAQVKGLDPSNSA